MRKTFMIILFVMLSLSFTMPAHAFLYSLVDDWSDASNPNGVWSYNSGNTPLPTNQAGWPGNEFGPLQTAWTTSQFLLPGWFKSITDPNPTVYDWDIGDVIVHSNDFGSGNPAVDGESNVTWTSPFDGIFDISGGLWIGRDVGRGNDWTLYLNNASIATGSLFSGDIYSKASPNTFSINNLFISSGSVLRLEVVKAANSQYGDFTGVTFNIDGEESNIGTIPEPASVLLFSTGLIGVFTRKKLLAA